MAYDGTRGITVLHGGQVPGAVPPRLLGDTWTWNGTRWTEHAGTPGPGLRTGAAMAFDSARGRTILFGGYDGALVRGDTWEFDGTTWTQVALTSSPTARSDHAMAYDLFRQRVVRERAV